MGSVTKGFTPTTSSIPSAAQWNAMVDPLYTEVNGKLDEANADLTSSDGLVGKSTAQTITGAKTWTGATQFSNTVTVGVDTTGHDVKLFGASAGAYALWDESADTLVVRGATAAAAGILNLQTGETTVVDGNKLGQINFQAPVEASGTDAILVGASIWAEADDTFAAANNDTDLVFAVAESETAAERMRLSYDGTTVGLTFSGATSIDTGGGALTMAAGDMTLYDDNNNADTSLSIGTSATERLKIEVLNGAANKTAEQVLFSTVTASGAAHAGQLAFGVDEVTIATINDDGMNVALGQTTANAVAATTITGSGVLSVTDETEATDTTTASLKTAGGIAWVKDAYVGDDMFFTSGAVLNFSAGDVTLTHSAGKLTFGGDGAVELDFNNHEMTNVDINSGTVDVTSVTGTLDGALGSNTPATAVVTTFTSTGIDDNATGEILQITDSGATVAGDFSATDLDGILGSNTAAAATVTTLTGSGVLSVTDETEATDTTTASLKTAGGIAWVKDAYVGDDMFFTSGAVLNFAAGDVTLTHSAGKLTFGGDGAVELDFNNHEMTNVDINSGAMDGVIIGANAEVAGTFSTVVAEDAMWGDASDGAVGNITDQDWDGTTIVQSGTVTLTSNRTVRATSTITIDQAITISKQDGQARGSFPVTHGSIGIHLGAILKTIGSKGIPVPIRPGADGSSLCGGIVQILGKGNIAINAIITAQGANASGDGGGGGGLVIIASEGTISGSSAIDVSAADGHATAAAKGGAGSYSGELGGHAGIGGSGGGGAGSGGYGAAGGGGGAGLIAGTAGGGGSPTQTGGGGGGGSLDNAGDGASTTGGTGAAGDAILAYYDAVPSIFQLAAQRLTTASSAAGGAGSYAGGAGGTNGGGGGGGGGRNGAADAGDGGDAQTTNPVGAGGGGGGATNGATGQSGDGGNGSIGSTELYVLSSKSIYAGLPGGQGGGGGGARGWWNGGSGGAAGTGAAGAAGVAAFVASQGAGEGGAGGTGANPASYVGGSGGKGGNGGGAAGLVILIAPTITYSGTVTGRLVKIDGASAHKFLRGIFEN